MKYLFAENYREDGKNAGSKARKDVEQILDAMGAKRVVLYSPGDSGITVFLKLLRVFAYSIANIEQNSFVLIQHPYIPFKYSSLLSTLA